MGNCLVTKLKENVNNNSLEKLGEFSLSVVEEVRNSSITLVYTDTSIVAYNQVYTNDATLLISQASKTSVSITGTGVLKIKDKYNLNRLYMYGGRVNFNQIEHCPLVDLYCRKQDGGHIDNLTNITQLNVFTNLKTLHIEKIGEMFGDIDDLNLKNTLTEIDIPECRNVIGSMTKLAKFKLLTNLGRFTSLPFTGTVEDFVAWRVAKESQSSGSVDADLRNSSIITFIGNTGGNSTIVWEPSENNTQITFNSNTTVISIASDGTWERIS